MPFAYCLDCGDQALIDPSGRCPEGHEVGAAGARVSAGIGSATTHPDEPVPWTRTVDLHPDRIDATAQRVARPPSVATTETSSEERAVDASTDDLFRELHALGDLGGDADPPAPPIALEPPTAALPATPASPSAPPAPPASGPGASAAGTPAPPSSPEEATDLDDLAGLVAAMRSLDDREDAAADAQASTEPPGPLGTSHGAPAAPDAETSAVDELDALFAADVRRDALADVAALDREAAAEASPPPPPPVAPTPPPGAQTPPPADAAPSQPAPPEAAPLDDLDFTARSSRSRRLTTPTSDKTARRGLFRR